MIKPNELFCLRLKPNQLQGVSNKCDTYLPLYLQVFALYGQIEDGFLSVLHTKTFLCNKRFLNFKQNKVVTFQKQFKDRSNIIVTFKVTQLVLEYL